MSDATFMKSSALFGQNVVTHHCRALRISASRLKSYSSSINLASSIVGFFGTVSSLNFPLGFYPRIRRSLFLRFRLSGNATLASRQRTLSTRPEPLHVSTSLFHASVSALHPYSIRLPPT